MKHMRSSILPRGSAGIALGLVSFLVAAAVLTTYGSDRSAAQDYSTTLSAHLRALAQQSGDGKAQSSSAASRPARSKRATRLRATPGCNSKREPFVKFRWIPARKRGRAQRVDYTEFFRGFSSRKFHKSREFAPGKRRWRTTKIETGLDYSWRVMTRRGHRWVSSKVRPFDGPLCVD